jgi:CRP-like cAMP-binding protein
LFYVLARGTVSVQIRIPTQTGEKKRRVASLGPGVTFGEMALFDGGARSADVIADERVICYGVAVERLQELAATHPNIMLTILANLTREILGASAPRQRGNPHAGMIRWVRRGPAVTSAAHRCWAQGAR